MTSFGFGRLCIVAATSMALTACQTGTQPFQFLKKKEAAAATASGASDQLITVVGGGDHDVEAPKVFSMTDKALWDGRPSLGGVWVAHSSVKDPERVIIRNPANGKSVIGALFRREIDNPGPSLQLSSDAAEALGLLAGQPAAISVVALRRAEVPAPAAPAAAAAPADAKIAAAAAEPVGKTNAAKPGAIDQKTLEATAAAAIDKAAAKPAKAAAKAAAKTAVPVAAPSPDTATAVKRGYIQIGIFSVEANAKKAAAQMTKAGLNATVKPDQSQGKTFWRVLIGPAATLADRDKMAAKVKGLGYPDAYAVSK